MCSFMHGIENLVCTLNIVEHSVHLEMGIKRNGSELYTSGLREITVDKSKKAIILDGMAII